MDTKKIFATAALIFSFATGYSQTDASQDNEVKQAVCGPLEKFASDIKPGTDGERPICKEMPNETGKYSCEKIFDVVQEPITKAVDDLCKDNDSKGNED